MDSEIEARNSQMKGYERVRQFVILDEDFTTANGMLTPTLKVKRNVVVEKYSDEIEALYAA